MGSPSSSTFSEPRRPGIVPSSTTVGTWGRRSSGTGIKYQPFTGGEDAIPQRGLYRSELFIFAVLFLVVEGFALILAGSYMAPTNYYPLLYLAGGSGVVLVVTLWYMLVGGGRF